MKNYYSTEVLNAEDLYDLQEAVCSTCEGIQYHLTEQEKVWLSFVRGKYSIADFIDLNLSDCGNVFTLNDYT